MKHILISLVIFLLFSCNNNRKFKSTGSVFGTTYNITYIHDSKFNLDSSLDSLFTVINSSVSTYQSNSLISQFNNGQSNLIDSHFETVFKSSDSIFKLTDGLFDPTIGKLVNAYNFGPTSINEKHLLSIDSLMQYVGFEKLRIQSDHIFKTHDSIFLDFNAIAKGYAVDVVSLFMSSKGIKNHIVEIGGEIRTNGSNIINNKNWVIGIENPNFDGSQSLHTTLELSNNSMATSGTYRKFKLDSLGNKYSHIINAKTGYPSKSNILSVSVLNKQCMVADALATAFQAMGMEKLSVFLDQHNNIPVYVIYIDDDNNIKIKSFNSFPE